MTISHTDSGTKVHMEGKFPTKPQLDMLNEHGIFYINTKRGYPQLIQVTNADDPPRRCEHECPLTEWFKI